MKTFCSMKKTEETKKLSCDFCSRSFIRESTIYNHVCEQKRRWQDKDKHGNRIGYQAWVEFLSKNTNSKKRDYTDFIKSSVYIAFVKFGNYCVDVNVVQPNRYLDWLLKNNIKIHTWCNDSVYTDFIKDYLLRENPLDAINRSFETCNILSEQQGILSKDILRYGNFNKICYNITKGKISPWMLYQSSSGTKFLDTLDESQVKLIVDYINPEAWALKFIRNTDEVSTVKQILQENGY